jgi:hypothetical protein
MNILAVALAAWAVLVVVTPVSAHHSFAAEFDDKMPIELKGTLSKMEWVNPHGWIYIDVKQADGKVVTWAVEGTSGTALIRRGLRKSDFPIGVGLMVYGYRARNGTPTLSGERVTFADGRNFYLGASEAAGPPKN